MNERPHRTMTVPADGALKLSLLDRFMPALNFRLDAPPVDRKLGATFSDLDRLSRGVGVVAKEFDDVGKEARWTP